MFKARKSLDNGIVHLVFRVTSPHDNQCVGVFSNLKDAKCHIIRGCFESLDVNHYNPSHRFRRHKDVYSLSKEAPIIWEDTWKQSGVTSYFMQSWRVDTACHETMYCTLDAFIKAHIVANEMSWVKVRDLLDRWQVMTNHDMFLDTCFSTTPSLWSDDVLREKWIATYEVAEVRCLTRHMSLMKRTI